LIKEPSKSAIAFVSGTSTYRDRLNVIVGYLFSRNARVDFASAKATVMAVSSAVGKDKSATIYARNYLRTLRLVTIESAVLLCLVAAAVGFEARSYYVSAHNEACVTDQKPASKI